MIKCIFVVSLVILTFSLSKCAKEDDKKKMNESSRLATEEMHAELVEAITECNNTFRIEMSYLMALNESGSFPDETDRTPKCFVRCVLETTKVSTVEAQYDAARAAVVFGGEMGGKPMDVREMANNCVADRKESCKCEKAYQFLKCLMQMKIQQYQE